MSADEEVSPQQFASAYVRLAERAMGQARQERSPFKARLTEHFGEDPATYPLTREAIAVYDLPNLQLALDAYLGAEGREHSLVGFGGPVDHMELSLAGLVHDFGFGLAEGPVRRTIVPLERGRSITCVTTGLFLISDGEERLAARGWGHHGFEDAGLRLEVIAPEQEAGERFLADIRALMHARNVFRGKVLALKGGDEMMNRGMVVEFPAVEPVSRDQLVLPVGVLDMVELHTVEFARHSESMREAGRHLRRGLLLHGPPGILTGAALGLIADACAIARDLQPAMVVLEDVDLVAQERTAMGFGATSLLFRLLNEMDGIGEDADVVFLMTTNRADLLEPALAARPGRVDQAVAFPLPDAEARARLLDLFGRGLDVALRDRDAIVAATDGVSPAFLRELVRKAALHAARAGSARVEDAHFRGALDLLERGGSITRAVLGADGDAVRRLDPENGWDEGEWAED